MSVGIVPVRGRAFIRLLRSVISRTRVKLWVTQFLIDARPREDSANEVRFLLHALAEAANRGVDVRVLVPDVEDPLRSGTSMSESALRFLRHRGVDARRYAVRRDGRPHLHSKVVISDDTIALVGNANWTPQSFRRDGELTLGVNSTALVESLGRHFERLWRHQSRALPGWWKGDLSPGKAGYWPKHRLVADPHLQSREVGSGLYARLEHREGGVSAESVAGFPYVRLMIEQMRSARHEVRVMMAGLRASSTRRLHALLGDLCEAQRRGCRVRVLYDPHHAMQRDWALDVQTMRRQNLSVLPWSGRSRFHIRGIVFDDDRMVVGSVGWTPQSIFLTEERSVVVRGHAKAIDEVSEFFDGAWRTAENRARGSQVGDGK